MAPRVTKSVRFNCGGFDILFEQGQGRKIKTKFIWASGNLIYVISYS